MIIFVGGFVGAGKSSIARRLAERYSFHYYDIDEVKKAIYPQDPDFKYNLTHGIPFKDETRLKVYEKVVSDFADLAQHYTHLVVDETLHKQKLRQILFDGAKKHFGDYIIIWIQTDETIIKERLTSKERTDHMLKKDPMKMYRSFAKEFENFERSYIVCHNNSSLDEATASLFSLFDNLTSIKK